MELITAVYLRVSTQDQSTDAQRQEINSFIQAKRYKNIRIYEDKATGTNNNRPMLRKLLQDCNSRQVGIVICYKLDRFFRSLKDLINTLQQLDELKIAFIALKDNVDLSTPSGRLMMHMIGAFAEFEASLIQERVKSGLKAAKARGIVLGRPRLYESTIPRLMRKQGHSIREISRKLGIPKSTVNDLIKTKPHLA